MADVQEQRPEEATGDRVEAGEKSVAAEPDRDPLEDGTARVEEDVVRGSSPYASDGHEAASVYVVSSGEDEDDCPDEEDFDEMDDMDEDDLDDDEEDMDEEEEFDDEETDEEDHAHLEGQDSNDMMMMRNEMMYRGQPDDDWDPRYSNGIGSDHMGKSQSLQDLSICDLLPQEHIIKKRRSVDILDHKHFDHHDAPLFMPHRRHSAMPKFGHVESKVKLYIRDMKERSRISNEKRRKSMEAAVYKGPKEREEKDVQIENQEVPRSTRIKNLKEFAESTIKELEIEEARRSGKIKDMAECEVETVPADSKHKLSDNKKNLENHKDDGKKPNGTMDVELVVECSENGAELEEPEEVCLENGIEEVQTILNVRTMDYDEYMRGSSNTKPKTPIKDEVQAMMYESNGPLIDSEFHGTELKAIVEPCEFRIDNVQSIKAIPEEEKEDHDDSDVIMETSDQEIKLSTAEDFEAAVLRSQLDQKTSQCRAMRDAYEKTLSENFELKQELEDLRKVLAGYRKEKKPKETKSTAVQTEPPPPPPQSEKIKDSTSLSIRLNKCSTSTLGSVASSNDLWQDSAETPPVITMTPPSITPLLNSDDSYVATEATPRRSSHAFLTSSRIMKTLANITHGRSRVNNSVEGRKSEGMTPTQPGNPKKRKATDMPAKANILQPPKMAHTSVSRSQKRSRTEENVFKYPGDYMTANSRKRSESAGTSGKGEEEEEMEEVEGDEEEDDDDDQASGVKCFTFHDDDHGQEKSFLIQAEGETEDSTKIGIVRECGPYLLGNVEVRMSEVNGTINIWGKEISQDSIASETPSKNINGPEELDNSSTRSCHQNTPHSRFASNGHMVCSTNKKPRIPPLSLDKTSNSRSSRSALASAAKLSTSNLADNFNQHRQQPSCSFNADTANNCSNCDSRFCANSKRTTNYREQLPEDFPKKRCGCHWEQGMCDRAGKLSQDEHRCSSSMLNPGRTPRCPLPNNLGDYRESFSEANCRHHAGFASIAENACRFNAGNVNSFRGNIPCGDHSTSRNCSFPGGNDSHCRDSGLHQDSPLIDNEEDPLLPNRSCEAPEVRRRRLIGKRVRGILGDLLGCGDCRNNKANKVGPSGCENDAPQIRVTSCTPPSTCTNVEPQTRETQQTTHYGSTNRCAHACSAACSRRKEITTELEIQVETFQAELERLHSRSDALRNMLLILKSTDAA